MKVRQDVQGEWRMGAEREHLMIEGSIRWVSHEHSQFSHPSMQGDGYQELNLKEEVVA